MGMPHDYVFASVSPEPIFTILILLLAIGLLPIFVREFRNNTRIMLAYWFVIALHQVVAFTNAFIVRTLGATGDANFFHVHATWAAEAEVFWFNPGAELYYNMLGRIYWLFGPSNLLGEQFSILAFAVSCIVLIKIMDLLELSRYRVSALLVFGALPSMVFFGSITLREGYQILFFLLTVYFGMLMFVRGRGSGYFILMFVSALCMGIFHRGIIVYTVLLVVVFMVWTPHPGHNWLSISKRKLVSVLTMLPLLAGLLFLVKEQYLQFGLFKNFSRIGLLEYIAYFREDFVTLEGLATARSAYFVVTDFSSLFATIGTFFSLLIHYLFAPFPWQIKNAFDVCASIESILRLVLIYCSVLHWKNSYGVQRRVLGLLLFLYFSLSFLWSVGTSNYGTGARHHIMAWWILAVTGTPVLMKTLSRFRLS